SPRPIDTGDDAMDDYSNDEPQMPHGRTAAILYRDAQSGLSVAGSAWEPEDGALTDAGVLQTRSTGAFLDPRPGHITTDPSRDDLFTIWEQNQKFLDAVNRQRGQRGAGPLEIHWPLIDPAEIQARD